MDRFAAYVAEHCPDTTVVVHRGWNTDLVPVPGPARADADAQHKPMRPDRRRAANELLGDRLDDHASTTYGWE